MEIPYTLWYPAIAQRHSRRKFDSSRPIPREVIATLRRVCAEFRPFSGARVELGEESPDQIFKGVIGPYGKVKAAPAYLTFIGNSQDPHVQEAAGYSGEGMILEATALGLSTCWVAGMFRKETTAKVLKLSPDEKVLAVSPIGYTAENKSFEEKLMSRVARSHLRKPLNNLVTGIEERLWPVWIKPALEAARLAPSASNRQPWRFRVEADSIIVFSEGTIELGVSKRLDCGIAMLHLEVAALNQGIKGIWELLPAPQVARFRF